MLGGPAADVVERHDLVARRRATGGAAGAAAGAAARRPRWPWPLTPLTGRAIGAWNVGLGIAAGHAWLVDDAPSLVPVGVTGALFGVLQTVALLRHGDELDWSSPAAVGYVVGLAAVTVVGAWLLLEARRGADAPETGP